jgi:hypothetical protein
MALIDRLHPKPLSYWFGVPRFLIRRSIESLPRMVTARLHGDLPGTFEQELNLWFMLGFVGGKLFPGRTDHWRPWKNGVSQQVGCVSGEELRM